MEDQVKVQARIEELSKATGHKWIALSGNHAITKVNIKDEEYEFVPSSGIPLKLFVDLVTGEVKPYLHFIFEVDKSE